MEGSILESLKKHWYLVLAIVGFLVWFTDKVVEASNTLSDVHESIQDNEDEIVELKKDAEKHETSVGHSQLSERLIRVETELVHINKSQSESFQDIKLQLNILQQDIKEISKN